MRAGADALGVDENDARSIRQHVDERLHAGRQQRRHERLHALDGDALADLRQHVGDAQQARRELSRALTDLGGEQQFAARRGPQPVRVDLERTLVGHLEPADLLDGVAPELQAHRVILGGREHVEDATAHGELAAALDHVDARVGRGDEGFHDVLERALVTCGEAHGFEVAEALRHGLHEGAHRRDDDADGPVRPARFRVPEAAQHGETPPDRVGTRRHALVRQRLPRRELGDVVVVDEVAQGRRHVVGLAPRRGDDEHRPRRVAASLQQSRHERSAQTGRGRDVDERLVRGQREQPLDGFVGAHARQQGRERQVGGLGHAGSFVESVTTHAGAVRARKGRRLRRRATREV